MKDENGGIIFAIIAVVFGLPLVSVYALSGFESSLSYSNSEITNVNTVGLNIFDKFIEVLTKLDASIMSFFDNLRQTY